ncbi:MAG: thioesterase family protein [Rhodovarius sp.]|nr:acyl-CoA thioesterase [Rhodovarius sp.]MCX7933140.1 acyl-CoA thioesterase [Rhodovarius sp.]MDW8314532.1 thioesterase family protein [Rhodovarius sp.]
MSPAITRRHRVRWCECDMFGHVNHTAYLLWCEDLRVAHWESLGQSFCPGGVGPVVARLEARYLAPLAYGEEVTLTLSVPSLRRSSFVHDYAVWRGEQQVFACRAVVVCVDNATGRPIPIPPEARALLTGRDGALAE